MALSKIRFQPVKEKTVKPAAQGKKDHPTLVQRAAITTF